MDRLLKYITQIGDKAGSLYPWFQYAWSTYVTYSALGFMVVISIWDIFSPANHRCDDESCAI